MIAELLVCVGIAAVGVVGGAIASLIPETRGEREENERRSNPRRETNAEAHRRRIDELDNAWCVKLNNDLEWACRLVRNGQEAKLLGWYGDNVTALIPSDNEVQPPNIESIVHFRNRRRRMALEHAERLLEEAKEQYRREQDERERRERKEQREREHREREEQYERQRREWEAQYKREEQERERQREAQRRAEEARDLKLSMPIPLAMQPGKGIVFGTRVKDGEDLVVPLNRLQHMLVAGVSGAGKSVFLHQLVAQFVRITAIEKLYVVDLKGGVEFYRYRDSGKVEIVWEFDAVLALFDRIAALMVERESDMRARELQNWPDGRIVVIIDEYAEIQGEMDTASTREDKERAKRLAANLTRIARRARALGITLICALQKPTTDAMDSAIRTNLGCRVCFRVGSRALAASLLDDLDDAPADPVSLPAGRCIYYDSARGKMMRLQVQIAPGVSLDGSA